MIKGFDYSPVVEDIFEEQEIWAQRIKCTNIFELNEAVRKGYASGYILISEALQERKIASIADRVAQHPDIKIILIAGPSSSGKTSFTQRLRVQLGVDAIGSEFLSMDNYFVEREHNPKNADGSYNFDTPDSVDRELFNQQLQQLVNLEKVEVPHFNFLTGHKEYTGQTIQLDEHKVLIVEGIHALNLEMTAKIPAKNKLCVYITALNPLDLPDGTNVNPTDVRLIRRIVRDNQYRGFTARQTLDMWQAVREGELKYIYPNAHNADVVVNTSLIYELSVLKPYVVPLLKPLLEEYSYMGAKARNLLKMLENIVEIPIDDIPLTSIMREFVGGSTFRKHL